MKEFDAWRGKIDPRSIILRIRADSTHQPRFNLREYAKYHVGRERTGFVQEIELPLEVLQELWREKWNDQ